MNTKFGLRGFAAYFPEFRRKHAGGVKGIPRFMCPAECYYLPQHGLDPGPFIKESGTRTSSKRQVYFEFIRSISGM